MNFLVPHFLKDVTHRPRSLYSQRCVQVVKLNEILLGLDLSLQVAKLLNVVEIAEPSIAGRSFGNLIELFLNVAQCLLSHHSVVSFVCWSWTVVRV